MDGVLYFCYTSYYSRQLVVPQYTVGGVLDKIQEDLGYGCQSAMIEAINLGYLWPKQWGDIRNYTRADKICKMTKNTHDARAPLVNMKPGYPNETVEIDIIGPLQKTNRVNNYILFMVDHFKDW